MHSQPHQSAARATVFAASFATLFAAHEFGDHWVQSAGQAARKGQRDAEGQRACAGHVVTLTAAKALALAVTSRALGMRLSPWRAALALGLDAVTHYAIDRRYTLKAVAHALEPVNGKGGFYDLGDGKAAPCGTGAYALDQSTHVAMLWATALVIAVGADSTRR